MKDQELFADFFVATVLADIFDPDNNEDLDIVASKIVKGLARFGLLIEEKENKTNYRHHEVELESTKENRVDGFQTNDLAA